MKRSSVARLALLALLWGSSFLFIRVALEGLSPAQIVLARLVIGALVLLSAVAVNRLSLPRNLGLWGRYAVSAVINNMVPYYLFAWAEQTVPSNVAGALNTTTPLFTLALVVVLGHRRRVELSRVQGLALGLVGAVIVLAPWGAGDALGSPAGQLACLGAAASYAAGYVFIGRYIAPENLPPLVNSACQLTAAAALLVVLSPVVGGGAVQLSPQVVGAVLALGVLGTGIAYVLNYRLISDEGPTTASLVTYLLPIVAVALGVVVLGEPASWNLFVGTALVLAGVARSEGRLGQRTAA